MAGSSAECARPFHWLYAFLFSYFWKKCERCRKGFGGHQWSGMAMTRSCGAYGGTCAYCPSCARTRNDWQPGWLYAMEQEIVRAIQQQPNRLGQADVD
jgi:hypothetical protein